MLNINFDIYHLNITLLMQYIVANSNGFDPMCRLEVLLHIRMQKEYKCSLQREDSRSDQNISHRKIGMTHLNK